MIINRWREHPTDGHVYRLVPVKFTRHDGQGHIILHCLECCSEYSKAAGRCKAELHNMIEQGIEAAQSVAANWSNDRPTHTRPAGGGANLAGAVNELEAWANEAEEYTGDDIEVEEASIVEVSETAFGDFNHLCGFAREVAAILDCNDPAFIVRAVG